MQLTGALCYALLTITITATYIQAERNGHQIEERKADRKLMKRDSTVLIDSIPVGRMFQNPPKVVYRRVSKKRVSPLKPRYGPPRPKYGPSKHSRKLPKKHKGRYSSSYVTAGHKRWTPKHRYTTPKRPNIKPVYGPPKKTPEHHYHSEDAGFGEPPTGFGIDHSPPKTKFVHDFLSKPSYEKEFTSKPSFGNKPYGNDFSSISNFEHDFAMDFPPKPFNQSPPKISFSDYQTPEQTHGEPPVDSYGAPINTDLSDLASFPTAQTFSDNTRPDDYESDFQMWKHFQDQKHEIDYAHSKKRPSYSMRDSNIFVTPIPEDEELNLNSYSDIYNHRQKQEKKNKKFSYQNVKILNQPWKGNMKNIDDDIIVGGQYAEPPARYVSKFLRSAPILNDDVEFGSSHILSDPDVVSPAAKSSYVNYKNSNMAFSPQNLNDAFSIVDT